MAADFAIAEAAPAKINLYLHVTGRRDDGYHLLDSLVVFADAGDIVRAKPAETLSLRIEGLFADGLTADGSNLVMRAAASLAALFGVSSGAEIALEKNLPVSSGIGGGSADAAATIRALARLWGLNLDAHAAAVSEMALGLGADVPVCMRSRSVRMQGVGETLSAIPALPQTSIVLVNPGVAVSTPDVFRARRGDLSEPADWPGETQDAAALFAALATTNNDLQTAAIELAPVIRDVLNALEADPKAQFVRMSGSGATCFALFSDEAEAQRAAAHLRTDHPDWWINAANIL